MNKYWIHEPSGQKAEIISDGDTIEMVWKGNNTTYQNISKESLEEFYIPITKAEYDSNITLKEIKASRKGNSSLEVGGSHYQTAIQPWDYIAANSLGFDEGNVIKYVSRHKRKNGVEDIRKAISYCKHILETQYGEKG